MKTKPVISDRDRFIQWFLALQGTAKGGDNSAIREVVFLARESVGTLTTLAEKQPELLRPIAEKVDMFPGLITSHAARQIELDSIYAQLGIGTKAATKTNRRTADDFFSQRARSAIGYLCNHVDGNTGFYFSSLISWDNESKQWRTKIADFKRKHPLNQGNWTYWKPIFDAYFTLRLGTPTDRWQLIPDFWKDNLYIATEFGCFDQWKTFSPDAKKVSPKEWDNYREEERVDEKAKSIFYYENDPAYAEDFKYIKERRLTRKAGFSVYRTLLLNRTLKLLPP